MFLTSFDHLSILSLFFILNFISLYHKPNRFSIFIIKIAFRRGEKLFHFFTITYYLLLITFYKWRHAANKGNVKLFRINYNGVSVIFTINNGSIAR